MIGKVPGLRDDQVEDGGGVGRHRLGQPEGRDLDVIAEAGVDREHQPVPGLDPDRLRGAVGDHRSARRTRFGRMPARVRVERRIVRARRTGSPVALEPLVRSWTRRRPAAAAAAPRSRSRAPSRPRRMKMRRRAAIRGVGVRESVIGFADSLGGR